MGNKTLRRGLAAVALGLGLVVALSSARADGTLDRILREKKVRVGWSSYDPMTIRDPKTGDLVGYYFDAVRYMFKEVDVEPQFMEVTYANLIASIQSGEIDLSIANSFASVKRAAAVDFTRPLLFVGDTVAVRTAETRFKTLEDLNKPGVKIATLLGSEEQDFIRRNMPAATLVALNTNNRAQPFIEVSTGGADAAIMSSWNVKRFVTSNPEVKELVDQPFATRPTAWIVKKGNTDLLNFVNTSLDTLILSGVFNELARKFQPSGHLQVDVSLKPFP